MAAADRSHRTMNGRNARRSYIVGPFPKTIRISIATPTVFAIFRRKSISMIGVRQRGAVVELGRVEGGWE
jgi:hypothetical protein